MYAAGRQTTVLLAVAHADRVSICGPDANNLPVSRSLPSARAEELCAAALDSGDWSRLLATLRSASDAPLIRAENAIEVRPVAAAEDLKRSDEHWMRRRAFFEWMEFLLGQIHVLRVHPELLPQQAANQPRHTAPAQAAAQWREGRGKGRLWFRLLNPARESSACVSVLSGHVDGVSGCGFLPGGDQLVSTSLDGTVKVWDLMTGRIRLELQTAGQSSNACAVSPEGASVVAGGVEGLLYAWASSDGNRRALLRPRGVPITSIAFAPDGGRVVAGYADGTIELLDTATWTAAAAHASARAPVHYCGFSPCGRWLIAAAGDTLLRWNAERPGEPVILRSHDEAIAACAISPDGRWILSAADGEFKLTSPDGVHKRSMKLRGSGTAAAFSPDGRWLAFAHGSDLDIRDTHDDGKARYALRGHRGDVTACRFSPDGRLLASCSRDGTIRLWLVERIPSSDAPLERETVSIQAVSLDGRRTATVVGKELTVWEQGKETTTVSKLPILPAAILACEFSPNGWTLVAAGEDKVLRVWRSLNPGATLKAHRGRVSACAFSPDGRYLASGSADHTVRLWDARNWSHVAALDDHEGTVNAVLFETGRGELHVVSASDDGTVRCWTPSEKKSRVWTRHSGPVRACGFSPDYRWLASASDDGAVKVWGNGEGRVVATLEGQGGQVRGCAYSADGRWVLSVPDDGNIRVWDAAKFTLHATFATPGLPCDASAFSPDGAHLAAATESGVSLWNLERRAEVGRFITNGRASSLRWSRSGCLAVGTDAGAVHLLRVENIGPLRLTPWRRPSSRNWFERKKNPLHFGCPNCLRWSGVESSPSGDEILCPTCHAAIRLNSSVIEAEWEPVQTAWGE